MQKTMTVNEVLSTVCLTMQSINCILQGLIFWIIILGVNLTTLTSSSPLPFFLVPMVYLKNLLLSYIARHLHCVQVRYYISFTLSSAKRSSYLPNKEDGIVYKIPWGPNGKRIYQRNIRSSCSYTQTYVNFVQTTNDYCSYKTWQDFTFSLKQRSGPPVL